MYCVTQPQNICVRRHDSQTAAPIAVFDLENDSYHVPVGLGLGRVIPTPSVVYNVFIEPQFTILDRGAGQPELQLFVGFNMQFLGS